ncbi:hypothetical protein UABAM_04218 [Candidatus Uabimicrobium amorphum]|uniref:Uncharacterized protein n=1 Tax=Uabimicrobium amorphum TaxID=2596890 RepID=A0A5S9IQQ9_UABAM|nr:hypothetical protein UABAM_04218 [Candidatus Uabimicrobium amorphum]
MIMLQNICRIMPVIVTVTRDRHRDRALNAIDLRSKCYSMKDLRIHVIPAKAGNQQYKFDLKASGSLIKSGMTRGVSLSL